MRTLIRTATVGGLIAFAGASQAGLTFFTDEATFLAELTAFQTETFSVQDQLLEPGSPVTGDLLTISADGTDNFFDDAGINSGALDLAPEAAAHQSYTISGLGGATAFGATFQSPQSSSGFILEFGDDTMTLNGMWTNNFGTNFLGWISDGAPVNEFRFLNNSFEIFTMDNAHFGIPAPSAMAAFGLAGLAATRRRR